MDGLFEVRTLIQNGKMAPIPVVLVGRSFWSRAVDFDYLVGEGYIEPRDSDLFTCVDEAEEVVAALEQFHRGQEPAGAPTGCARARWLAAGGPGEGGGRSEERGRGGKE